MIDFFPKKTMDSEKQAYYAPVPQRVNKFKVFVCSLLACYVVYGSVLKYGQSDLKIQKVSDNGVDWQPCGDLLCATLMVPMNHLNPNSKMIGVAMNKYPAKIQPAQKTMLVNPGGPGGSGKHMVQGAGPMFDVIFEGKVDIIGFDPRAVGDTNPLKCYGPSQIPLFGDSMKVFGQSFIPKNASIEQIKVFDSYIELSAELCALNTGEFLEYTSTANVARDMDLIRKALGMEKMDYWGFSYGTFLGATYANMFPENVGNMIIDGIVNPTDFSGDIFDFLKGDLRETTSVLKSLGDECDKTPNCVLYEKGTYSLLRILKVINDLKSTPLLVMDSVIPGILTSETVEQILFSSLYRSVTWPQFTKGIKSAEKGNGKELYELGIDTKSVQCPGTNVNDMSANSAILCADTAPSSSQYSLEDWIDLSKKYSDELSPLAAHQWASEFLPWYYNINTVDIGKDLKIKNDTLDLGMLLLLILCF
jgi:pimeloyl-ACP methyl ester carboxylesterase